MEGERRAATAAPESQTRRSQHRRPNFSVPLNLAGRAPALVSCEQEGYKIQPPEEVRSPFPGILSSPPYLTSFGKYRAGKGATVEEIPPQGRLIPRLLTCQTRLRTKELRGQPVYLSKTALLGKTSSRVASRAGRAPSFCVAFAAARARRAFACPHLDTGSCNAMPLARDGRYATFTYIAPKLSSTWLSPARPSMSSVTRQRVDTRLNE